MSELSRSVARVRTEVPKRYMTQLCKHFDHRLDVTLEEERGRIAFESGLCLLRAEPGELVMQVQAPDEVQRRRTEDVVARHLLRFAFREPPEIVWQQAPA